MLELSSTPRLGTFVLKSSQDSLQQSQSPTALRPYPQRLWHVNGPKGPALPK
jgi:hypothetical protein